MIGFSIMMWFSSALFIFFGISLLKGNYSSVHGKVFETTNSDTSAVSGGSEQLWSPPEEASHTSRNPLPAYRPFQSAELPESAAFPSPSSGGAQRQSRSASAVLPSFHGTKVLPASVESFRLQ